VRIELSDFQGGYVDLVRAVAAMGQPAAPRGLPTRELLGAQIMFTDTSNMLPVGVGRGVSTALNVAHAASIVAGRDADALMHRIAPRLAEFNADGIDRERYGQRLAGQWEGAVRHILADPDTREAIMTLQPARTSAADGGRDFPCTTSVQVMLRDGKLHLFVNMRSNDVWHGISGDAFLFATLQRTMAWILGVEPGAYIHTAASLHIYERDIPLLDKLHEPDRPGWGAPGIVGESPVLDPEWAIEQAHWWADYALGKTRPDQEPVYNDSARRYREPLEKYL
jgi:thymidylate synthase